MPGSTHEITRLLQEWSDGSNDAFDALIPLVYDDLSRIASRQLRNEPAGHTLCTQALVHESYINLVGKPGDSWRNRSQFFAVASKAMRRILIGEARRRRANRRGGDARRVTWTDRDGAEERDLDQLLAIDETLTNLAERSPRMARVVECRIFGGMTVKETAEALETSRRTVDREWTRAKTYMYRELQSEERDEQ